MAVITDCMADSGWLPVWADYYGGEFGRENLFICVYDPKFDGRRIGVTRILPIDRPYHEAERPPLFKEATRQLLEHFNVVLRVDVDEFLIPDPRRFPRLRDYVETIAADYVTARGLDVVQMVGDPELDFSKPLLAQRRFGIKVTAYSKTCVVRRPVDWSFGFHTINEAPHFSDLYLFHMKFADIASRRDWLDLSIEISRRDEAHHRHFTALRREFESTLRRFQALPRRLGPEAIRDDEFSERMRHAATRGEDGQFTYPGLVSTDVALCEIPEDFQRLM